MSVPALLAEHLEVTLDELSPEMPLEFEDSIDVWYLRWECENETGRKVPDEKLLQCRNVADWILACNAKLVTT